MALAPPASERLAERERGVRHPAGMARWVLFGGALGWSLFQLWYASPLPFWVADLIPVLNNTQARSVHLAFALFLAFLAFPAFARSPRQRVPRLDWVFAVAGAFCAAYLLLFYESLAERAGAPILPDLIVAGVGLVLLLEATRRALGPALLVVALVFLAYVFFGRWAPDVIAWKGASFERAMSHQWLTTEGVFGVALGVSTDFVFVFVLFGALLERAGAGAYFIRLAFAGLGHLRGGPAKAAVVASGLTGLVSGSSIANTVTTGTFTIPLMKRVGFSRTQAGAVEVASSVNGQLMPPVMGAAAFLMVEYVGLSYLQVIQHALLPALVAYAALLYMVHLEAVKAGVQPLPRRGPARGALAFLRGLLVGLSALVLLAGGVYLGLARLETLAGPATPYLAAVGLLLAYLGLLGLATHQPTREGAEVPGADQPPPAFGPTLRGGLYYFLPVGVLLWCLVVERLSPGLSAFWATMALLVIVLTQHPLVAWFGGRDGVGPATRRGLSEAVDGLVLGARNMIGIAVATATAGIIVGSVTLTGIGQVMTEFVGLVAGDSLVLMLLLVAGISLILGMGLPTTANYIVVSSLMAGVVVELGAEQGLVVPLIAVHLFVFYFGIMADVTPPVGLASYAAAAVSGANPIATGVKAFVYCLRLAALPFMFLFNTKLILIDIAGPVDLVLTVAAAFAAALVFAAATQGYFLVRNRLWETLALLLVAFTLFRPDFWLDRVQPPFVTRPGVELYEAVARVPAEGQLRVTFHGEDFETQEPVTRTVPVTLPAGGDPAARLAEFGLVLRRGAADRFYVDRVRWGSPAADRGIDLDWVVEQVGQPRTERWPEALFLLPGLGLLALVGGLQGRRRPAGTPARRGEPA